MSETEHMDPTPNQQMWHRFMKASTWATGFIVLLLIVLAVTLL